MSQPSVRDPAVPIGHNIEIKARLAQFDETVDRVTRLAGKHVDLLQQVDTYFCCQEGRLKLREVKSQGGEHAELIWYVRDDVVQRKSSHYQITVIHDPRTLCQTLTAALGIRAVVKKRRQLHRFQNVRIHLDQVEQLGTFLELEAVQGPDLQIDEQRQLVDTLMDRLGIDPCELIAGSYVNLIEAGLSCHDKPTGQSDSA